MLRLWRASVAASSVLEAEVLKLVRKSVKASARYLVLKLLPIPQLLYLAAFRSLPALCAPKAPLWATVVASLLRDKTRPHRWQSPIGKSFNDKETCSYGAKLCKYMVIVGGLGGHDLWKRVPFAIYNLAQWG